MKRFEFTIDVSDEFGIDNESIDNIKSYLCYCFKVDNVNMNICGLPDWLINLEYNSIDPEIPF